MAAVEKTDRANLRNEYPIFIEVGLVLTLAILIVAFRVEFRSGGDFEIPEQEQEVVEIEEVEQTQQIEKPPPPPKPQVPVEVPDDEVVEDTDLDLNAELDLDAEPSGPPAPPPGADEEEEEEEDEVFVAVEQMPQLVGGISSVQQHIEYPEMAKKAGVEGTVVVQFVVDENGDVQDPRVLKGIGAGCDQEAIEAVKQAKFKPGMQRGEPVKVRFSLPVTFRLN